MSKKYHKKPIEPDYSDSSSSSSIHSTEAKSSIKEKYSAERLMMMLDKQKLEALEEEFNSHPDGIELPNFVWLMKCAMNVLPEERAELVLGLYYLFQEIDINGDEHMEWSEFTQYIIDAVMSRHDREKFNSKELTPAEVLEIAYSLKNKRFQISKKIDKNVHCGYIKHLSYFHTLDLIAYIEAGGQGVKLTGPDTNLKHHIIPNILAPAFVLSVAYSEKDLILTIICSDKSFHLYEKDKDGFRFLKAYKAEIIIISIWYFEKLKLWLTAGEDHVLRQYNIRKGEDIFSFKGHNSIIMDAVEIMNPLSFVSCSLDNLIIMWSPKDKCKIGVINTKHSRGIRCMDYSIESGGNLVSVGYEREIFVWCPELNLAKCYTGKLEGHNTPVVCCKFFRGKNVCVSVDERGNIRIWDIKLLSCLQVISNDKGRVDVSKLVTIGKHEKFIVAGKRLTGYELNQNVGNTEILYDIKPINVEFNSYYMQFIVLTRFDLRIYDCLSGQLKKIYTEFKSVGESELSAMTLDHRSRIIIVGDSTGALNAYNFSNGSLINTIRSQKKAAKSSNHEGTEKSLQTLDSFSEISNLLYCNEDKILIASTWGSNLLIFDIKDISKVSLLRSLKGGHESSDISTLAYSPYLSLIASGSSNGIISLWDFELGKLEASFFHHQQEINTLVFLEPFPVLMSCSKEGSNYLWRVNSSGSQCLMRFRNFSWEEPEFVKAAIVATVNVLTHCEPILKEAKKVYMKIKVNKEKKGKKGVDEVEESSFEWVEDKESGRRVSQDAGGERLRPYLYIGDSKGYIKIWSFEGLLEKQGLTSLKTRVIDKPDYNPYRKDTRNAESDLNYWKKRANNEKSPHNLDIESEILIKEWKAHNDVITILKLIPDPAGLISSSADKFLKIWSLQGQIWGIINLAVPEVPKQWVFPYKWENKRKSDIEKILQVLMTIDENLDIDPSFLTDPNPVKKLQPVKKSKNVHKTRPWKNRKSYLKKSSIIELDSSNDDEVHKEDPRFNPARKSEPAAQELKKKLDDMDEKRKGRSSPVKDFKFKQKNPEVDSKPKQKLPKISINKADAAGIATKFETKFSKQKSVKDLNILTSMKPHEFKGRNIFGPFSYKFSSSSTHNAHQTIRSTVPHSTDVKYQVGESLRLMKKAISTHNLARSSAISPYTEDLGLLNMKHKLLNSLTDTKVLMPSQSTSVFRK